MNTLRAIRDFALNYLARQENPQHTLDMFAIWFSVIFTAVIMLWLCHRGLIYNLRLARVRVKAWNLRQQPLRRAKLALQVSATRLRLAWYVVKPRQRLRAPLIDPSAFLGMPAIKHPAPHEHTLPPGEELPMLWCDPCKSYHAAPQNAAHHAQLQCKATYAPPSVQAKMAAGIAEGYSAGQDTAGLPAADLAKLPFDPPPPITPIPGTAAALNTVADLGEQALKDNGMNNVEFIPGQLPPGVVLFGGHPMQGIEGFKIEHQPPRQDELCHNPFCLDASDPNCIHPRKVEWLKRRMQSIIDQTLAGSKN